MKVTARRKHLPQSLTGEAISYTLGQWDKLLVFLSDGRAPGSTITSLKTPSDRVRLGRKNRLFMGDPKSGGRAARFYTLIGNCRRAGIDAQSYLTDLFTRLADPAQTTGTLQGLTPHGWAAE